MDPHNWADQGTIFTAAAACRSARLVKSGSTWYLYYDVRAGGIRVATGASPASLSDYGSNPILSGSGTGWETFVRHPFVLTPAETHDGGWHMLYDGRDNTSTSGIGAVGHATSADGLSWTRDTANNPVLSPTGDETFEGGDCAEPSAYWDGSNYHVFWAGFYLHPVAASTFPHHIGAGTSSDLTSVTRGNGNPILPLSQVAADFDCIGRGAVPLCAGDGSFHLYYAGFVGDAEVQARYASRGTAGTVKRGPGLPMPTTPPPPRRGKGLKI